MKVKLIFPARDNDPIAAAINTPPAGITLLAALVPGDVEVKLVDMLSGDKVDYDDSTDLVGITVRTPVAAVAYKIADQFRARGTKVVLGGPHASAVPLDAALHADAVAVGEAESTWPRVLDDFRAGCLKKFYVCGPVRFDPGDHALHHDLELPSLTQLPVARRDLLPRKRYRMDTIFTTRGCPYDCAFCPVPNLFGQKPRHRPIGEVLAEVDTLASFYFNLDDNVFGVLGDEQYYLEFFAELARCGGKRTWIGQGSPGVVESRKGREILRRAVESGLASVSMGIESVSQQGLAESGASKKVSPSASQPNIENIREQIRIVQDHGVFVVGWFVIGWDSDCRETYEATLEFANRAGVAPVILNLLPMPGTRSYDDLVGAGRMKSDLTWADYGMINDRVVYSHPTLSQQEMVACRNGVMAKGYSLSRMLHRSVAFSRRRPALQSFIMSILGQRNLKHAFGG